ncbi:aminotransferase class V-fold PLP-dependent enzyme [Streptomyces sp. NPDC127100]|uniref:aminotransferase class V-fold PLP-dependent enzyme n=1 Tax=Streptomyces sp. NPDC127100 TaxID=3347138 RepID=UPI003658DF14
MIHLNPAGLGRMPVAAREVLTRWARHEDQHGALALEERLDGGLRRRTQQYLAALLGAPADGITLHRGAAEAFAAHVARLPLGPGDRVWTTPYESASHLTALYALRDRTRCTLEVVPLRPDGDLDLEWMARNITGDVALVSLTHVPAVCGTVSPVEDVGRILAPHRCLYAVDASYSVGQLPVDTARIGCHLLTGDAWRFLGGPESAGFACTDRRMRDALAAPDAPALPPDAPAVAALHATLTAHAAAAGDVHALTDALRAAVEQAPGTAPVAPGRIQSGIVAFRHADLPAAHIRQQLARRGVVVWKTVAQQTPLLRPHTAAPTTVRASVRYDNTLQDTARFGEALREILTTPRPRPRPVAGARPAPAPLTAVPGPAAAGPPPARARRRSPGAAHLTLVTTPHDPAPRRAAGGTPG